MAKKEFTYRGKSLEELKKMTIKDVAALLPARQRRNIKRGFTQQQEIFLKKLRSRTGELETHCRNMIILPEMIGRTIKVYMGKSFVPVVIEGEMIGHYLGEFALTRKRVSHSSPGVGATRSSSNISVK